MNRLRELRIENGYLQSDVAKVINKSDRVVGFYESGERDPNSETWKILADFYNVSIDYLMGKSDVRNPQNIKLDDMDIAFASGLKGLNKENQETLKNIMDGLLAKQEIENKKKEENK